LIHWLSNACNTLFSSRCCTHCWITPNMYVGSGLQLKISSPFPGWQLVLAPAMSFSSPSFNMLPKQSPSPATFYSPRAASPVPIRLPRTTPAAFSVLHLVKPRADPHPLDLPPPPCGSPHGFNVSPPVPPVCFRNGPYWVSLPSISPSLALSLSLTVCLGTFLLALAL